jgi:molybdate-binding protein/DNA-binding transcriptional regulator YhcF (GntR family)
MNDDFLYQQISEEIRQDIINGKLHQGDRLPSIRDLTRKFNCTPGTVQKAYRELALQGLVVSRAGKGTHVSGSADPGRVQAQSSLRRANMVHQAETFLLEAITSGYGLDEIQQSINLAMDRWRSLQDDPQPTTERQVIRFNGSHDMAIVWLSGHMAELVKGASLQLNFTGSLGGLMALAEGRADLAGCHLWDAESQRYNVPFIQKLFPGKKMLVMHLAQRKLGLIVQLNNPLRLTSLKDLAKPGVRFLNRQSGSGTRVWLDETLHQLGIIPAQITGYENEKLTHSEVARAIAENKADAGIGLESAAAAFKLGSIPLVNETYDLVMEWGTAQQYPLHELLESMKKRSTRIGLSDLPGYDFSQMGQQTILEL